MAQPDTVERILDAASTLFAERGFTETSLRSITTAANVNLAAVNYHFGSKKALIQAVFSRYLTPYCAHLDRRLDLLVNEAASPQRLIEALFKALTDCANESGADPQQFMRLLGLAYSQSQAHLRRFILSQFGSTYYRFMNQLSSTLPKLDPVVFFWRLYFLMGAGVFTLSSYANINDIALDELGEGRDISEVIGYLIPAMTRMLQCDLASVTP